ncbi:hypothetical protein MYAM1_001515 [Malassezia yamatoensis]|uniref:Uncharacterized protein n=1 Tax=Malassezia yamatoensis TaxID=253288 RepID=A0AAJ5YT84_9BASI|nr:hypothetical protein MYAM1_001515 [Malassezia yamatoensis]
MDHLAYQAQRRIKIAYDARLSPNSEKFPWPEHKGLIASQDGLEAVLYPDDDLISASDDYNRLFLKHLISQTELAINQTSETELVVIGKDKQDWAVNEQLLERYVHLLSQPQSDQNTLIGAPVPQPIYLRHHFPMMDGKNDPVLGKSASIILREEGVAISQGTTGLKTWEASYRLGAYLIENQRHLKADASTFLELGSGSGFLGMVLARLIRGSAARVALTDLEGNVLERLSETIQLSTSFQANSDDAQNLVESFALDWRSVSEPKSAAREFLRGLNPAYILAADVVYDPELVGFLADAIHAALLGSGSPTRQPKHDHWEDNLPSAIVSSTVRNEATYDAFLQAIEQKHMRLKEVPLSNVTLAWPDSGEPALPVFPTNHDVSVGGKVKILLIQLRQ